MPQPKHKLFCKIQIFPRARPVYKPGVMYDFLMNLIWKLGNMFEKKHINIFFSKIIKNSLVLDFLPCVLSFFQKLTFLGMLCLEKVEI